jgi:hypothetical protein
MHRAIFVFSSVAWRKWQLHISLSMDFETVLPSVCDEGREQNIFCYSCGREIRGIVFWAAGEMS